MRAPIILTLQVDEAADAVFQDLRRRHFPPAQNRVAAHLTLFHNLPGSEEDAVLRAVAKIARAQAPFELTVAGPMRLGRGVALRIESKELDVLRAALAADFKGMLTAQDREKFRPHVTIQNKVASHQAAALFDHLRSDFAAFEATAQAIQLWRYRGGDWEPLAAVPLQGRAE